MYTYGVCNIILREVKQKLLQTMKIDARLNCAANVVDTNINQVISSRLHKTIHVYPFKHFLLSLYTNYYPNV